MKKVIKLKITAEYEIGFDAELDSDADVMWKVVDPKLLNPATVTPELVMNTLREMASEKRDDTRLSFDIFDELAEEAGELIHFNDKEYVDRMDGKIACGAENPKLIGYDVYSWSRSERRCPKCKEEINKVFKRAEENRNKVLNDEAQNG